MCPIIINSWCVPLSSTADVSHYHPQLMCPIIIYNWRVQLSSTGDMSNYHQQLMCPIIIDNWCVPLSSTTDVSHYHRQLMCPIIIDNWCVPLSSTTDVSHYHRQLMCPIIIDNWCVPLSSTIDVSHYHRQLMCPIIIDNWCVPLSSTTDVSHYHRQPMCPIQLQNLLEILDLPNGISERKTDNQWRCSASLFRIFRTNICVTQMLHTKFSRQWHCLGRHTLQVKHSVTELLQLAPCVHGSSSSNTNTNVMKQGTASDPWRNNRTRGQKKTSTPFYRKKEEKEKMTMIMIMMVMMITTVPTKRKMVGSQGRWSSKTAAITVQHKVPLLQFSWSKRRIALAGVCMSPSAIVLQCCALVVMTPNYSSSTRQKGKTALLSLRWLSSFQQPNVRSFNDTVSRSYCVLYGPLTITIGREGAPKDADVTAFEALYWNGVAE